MSAFTRVSRRAALLVTAACIAGSATFASAAPPTDPADLLRIRGGTVAADASHPYAAQLDVFTGVSYAGRCTGAVIGSQWVATAAHCVSDFRAPGSPVLSDLRVDAVIGTPGVAPVVSPPVRASATYAVKHPGFDLLATGLKDDFALLRLDTPVAVEALGLVTAEEAQTLASPGTTAEVIGWGLEGPGQARTEQLRETTMPLIADATCDVLDPFDHFIGASMICAGYEPPQADLSGTCAGDSGGPLMVRDAVGDRRLLGITSWGFDVTCATGPDVFSEVPVVAPPVLAAAQADAVAPLAAPSVRARAFGSLDRATVSLTANTGHLATRYEVSYAGGGQTGTQRGTLAGVAQTRASVRLRGLDAATRYDVTVTLSNALGSASQGLTFATR